MQQMQDNYIGKAFQAYKIIYKLTMEFMPFDLTFDFEAIISIELEISSLQIIMQHGQKKHIVNELTFDSY